MANLIITSLIFLVLYGLSPIIITLASYLVYGGKPSWSDFSKVLKWLNDMPFIIRISWPMALITSIYGVVTWVN
jgi:hypothetical protein